MRSVNFLVPTLLSLLVVACSVAEEDSGNQGSMVTVNPVGTDTKPGHLVVAAPPSNAPLGTYVIVGNQRISFGVSSDFRPGSYGVMVDDNHGSVSEDGINIQSMQTTTYSRLGTVTYNWPASSAPEIWEFGQGISTSAKSPLRGSFAGEQLRDVGLRIAGNYHVTIGLLFDGLDYTAVAGLSTVVDLSSFAQRRAVKVLPPAVKSLPDHTACNGASAIVYATRGGDSRDAGIQVTSPVVVGEYAGDGSAAGTYSIGMLWDSPSNAAPLPMSAGPTYTPPTFQLGRIDVANVSVTQNDGTTTTVPGRYVIERVVTKYGVDTYFPTCARDAPTNSGVTVIPGKYRVTTTFPTHDNSSPSVEFVTIP